MAVGRIVTLPGAYSEFGRIQTEDGREFTVEARDLPKNAKEDQSVAYKVELWENESGLAYSVKRS